MAINHQLLGKILASVAIGVADAGQIAVDPTGAANNPQEIADIITGFLQIWSKHPASGVTQNVTE